MAKVEIFAVGYSSLSIYPAFSSLLTVISLCRDRNYLSLFNPLFSLLHSDAFTAIFVGSLDFPLFHSRPALSFACNACLPFPCVSSFSLVPNIFPYLDSEQCRLPAKRVRGSRVSFPLFPGDTLLCAFVPNSSRYQWQHGQPRKQTRAICGT